MKALQAARLKNIPALGDDSGVFIEALDYFPGVHSRRWSGSEDDDFGRNERILKMLENEENRKAYLISRFSLVNPAGKELWKGVIKNDFVIAKKQRGEYGFGYDRILEFAHINICDDWKDAERYRDSLSSIFKRFKENNEKEHIPTVAELTQDEKNGLNQRDTIIKSIEKILSGLEKEIL